MSWVIWSSSSASSRMAPIDPNPGVGVGVRVRHPGCLGGSSPGHAFATGTEDSHWQGYFLTPGSPFSSGERAGPKTAPRRRPLSRAAGTLPGHRARRPIPARLRQATKLPQRFRVALRESDKHTGPGSIPYQFGGSPSPIAATPVVDLHELRYVFDPGRLGGYDRQNRCRPDAKGASLHLCRDHARSDRCFVLQANSRHVRLPRGARFRVPQSCARQ